MRILTAIVFVLGLASVAHAQYTPVAGQSAAPMTVARDEYGNAKGSQYDLAPDGAFDGQTIAVIQLYNESRFDFRVVFSDLSPSSDLVSVFCSTFSSGFFPTLSIT